MLKFTVFSASNLTFSTIAEAHRALELLEDYHSRLSEPQDRALRIAIERVIRIFKSRLFQALLGMYSYQICILPVPVGKCYLKQIYYLEEKVYSQFFIKTTELNYDKHIFFLVKC